MFVTFLKAMNNFSLLMRALRDEHKAKGWVFINPLSVLVTADKLHWTTLCQLHYHLHVGNVPERFKKICPKQVYPNMLLQVTKT